MWAAAYFFARDGEGVIAAARAAAKAIVSAGYGPSNQARAIAAENNRAVALATWENAKSAAWEKITEIVRRHLR